MSLVLEVFDKFAYIANIELGAGCGNFGNTYHADCFITDKEKVAELRKRCGSAVASNIECDATDVPCKDSRFNLVIVCNPNGYGFKEAETAEKFLSELKRILISGGKVLILSNDTNPYAASARIKKRIEELNFQSTFNFETEEIDHSFLYPGFEFAYTDLSRRATPNQKTILTCLK